MRALRLKRRGIKDLLESKEIEMRYIKCNKEIRERDELRVRFMKARR